MTAALPAARAGRPAHQEAPMTASSTEAEYDRLFWRAGVARRALHTLDQAIGALKLQRKPLLAEVREHEHAFAEFLVAHPEVREINVRRRAQEAPPCRP
jgi:hypothetical protein